MLTINRFKEEVYTTYVGNIKETNLYKNILVEINNIRTHLQNSIIKEEKIKNKVRSVFEDIGRDVHRTFHDRKFVVEGGLDEMQRVLEAISYIKQDVGYCQGMNFIAGALIYFLLDEEKAFWIFLKFLKEYDMTSLFTQVP
jgi:hypothetical protein